MLEQIKALWEREPLRVLFIVGSVGLLIYQGVKSGLGWEDAIATALAWAGLEFGRHKVTPVADPKL